MTPPPDPSSSPDLKAAASLAEAVSKPVEKLIDVVSKGIGTVYRPVSIRVEAKAEAFKLLTMERAKAEAEELKKDIRVDGRLGRLARIVDGDPELLQRAKVRLAVQELEGQIAVEAIADAAVKHLPESVSEQPVEDEWRRRFFKLAADVSAEDMQELWAKVLAGEIAKPSSFSARTLDTLHKLTKEEAEIFRRATALIPFHPYPGIARLQQQGDDRLGNFGLSFDDIMALRGAGLLAAESAISMSWPPGQFAIIMVTLRRSLKLVPKSPGDRISIAFIPLSSAGEQLLDVARTAPRDDYFNQLAEWLSHFSMDVNWM